VAAGTGDSGLAQLLRASPLIAWISEPTHVPKMHFARSAEAWFYSHISIGPRRTGAGARARRLFYSEEPPTIVHPVERPSTSVWAGARTGSNRAAPNRRNRCSLEPTLTVQGLCRRGKGAPHQQRRCRPSGKRRHAGSSLALCGANGSAYQTHNRPALPKVRNLSEVGTD